MVKAECRRAALVPEQAGNGMMGHLVASALAKLTFAPKGMVEGDGAEGVLARADYHLEVIHRCRNQNILQLELVSVPCCTFRR